MELLSHVGCPPAELQWQSEKRDRREHFPASSAGGRAGWAGCRLSQGMPRLAGTGAFHGAGRKAAGPSCGGGFLIDPTCPRVLQCPMGTLHAGPRAPALAVLSPAAAHPCLTSASCPVHQPTHPQESVRVLSTGDEVLRTNEKHEAPATPGSDAGTSHPAPCI